MLQLQDKQANKNASGTGLSLPESKIAAEKDTPPRKKTPLPCGLPCRACCPAAAFLGCCRSTYGCKHSTH